MNSTGEENAIATSTAEAPEFRKPLLDADNKENKTPAEDDATVSSSTSSAAHEEDSNGDGENGQQSQQQTELMGMALKHWSVYLGNVLLNFIHKECKGPNSKDCAEATQAQQQQMQVPQLQQQHVQQQMTPTSVQQEQQFVPNMTPTTGYCPCCHYHNQMALQQQQQQYSQQNHAYYCYGQNGNGNVSSESAFNGPHFFQTAEHNHHQQPNREALFVSQTP